MKRNFLFIFVSVLLLSHAAFAAKSYHPKSTPIGIKNFTLAPVHWHVNLETGGFGLQNQTYKIQYVQVTIESGEISVFTYDSNTGEPGKCNRDLDAQVGPFSVVCELAPHENLVAEMDFAKQSVEATGTYQVEMDS